MSGNHSPTSLHNIELLTKELGLEKIGRTSLFCREGLLVFSPAVAKNSQGYYWFDIREVNIERKNEFSPSVCLLVVRIVPDQFIVCPFEQIQSICEAPKTESSGKKKWEFLLVEGFTKIKNRHTDAAFVTYALDSHAALKAIKGAAMATFRKRG
jgi:hypothetical protein